MFLPSNPSVADDEVAYLMEKFAKAVPKVPTEKSGGIPSEVLKVALDSVPVCGLLDNVGIPIHPPSLNNSQGRLNVDLKMGGQPGLPLGLEQIIQEVGETALEVKSVYTGGTWKGFVARLAEQMSRKTRPLRQVNGKLMEMGYTLKKLDSLLPRAPNPEWPCLDSTKFYEDLTEKVKITANAGAGAPYHRLKGQCLEQVIDTVLPLIIKHIKEDSLEKLWKEQPELFIVRIKNKLDRYERKKLMDKTRPYACFPAHWALLFSVMTQGFQETLHSFEKKYQGEGNVTTSNAYGFSSAGGGMKAHYAWMLDADRRGRVVAYGDDANIIIKRDGKLYRMDPDFKQMDGSLDADDIHVVSQWVITHMERDAGHKLPFWRSVAKIWAKMSVDPYFIIDGKKVYRKVSPHGLLTGVPGTTLFDTVKSAVAWNDFLDDQANGSVDFLDEKAVIAYMAARGLHVKEGTWVPEVLPPAVPGNLMTDHKFLGTQMKCIEWRGRKTFVPTIPYDDALDMLIVQKDNPFDKTKTIKMRTLYDRMRGLMITFGFSDPNITSIINNVVNSIPAEYIIMDVQDGTGKRPEHITLQDFEYPDASGFPSYDFCVSVYDGDKSEENLWTQIFPDILEKINHIKDERRKAHRATMDVKFDVTMKEEGVEGKRATFVPRPELPLDPEYQEVSSLEVAGWPKQPLPAPRSKIVQVEASDKMVEKKIIPTLGQSIKLYLKDSGGFKTVSEVSDRFGIEAKQILIEAQKYGIYLTGLAPGALVSVDPLATASTTVQEHLVKHWTEKRTTLDKGTLERDDALKRQYAAVITAPPMVEVNHEMVVGLPDVDLKDGEDIMQALFKLLLSSYSSMAWASEVNPRDREPVTTSLVVKVPGSKEWHQIAEAKSLSKRLGMDYIAKAILELNDFRIESSQFTVKDFYDRNLTRWDEMEEEEHNPFRAPHVVEMGKPYDPELGANDPRALPDSPRKQVRQAINEGRDPSVLVLARPAPTIQGVPNVDGRSKRSFLTPEKRTALNRKMHERRKNKLKNLSLSPTN